MHIHALFSTTHISTYVFNVQFGRKKTNTKGCSGSQGNCFHRCQKTWENRKILICGWSSALPRAQIARAQPSSSLGYRGICLSHLSLAPPCPGCARERHCQGKGWPKNKLFQLLTAAGHSLGIRGQLAQVG